jgi:hypothetical protein
VIALIRRLFEDSYGNEAEGDRDHAEVKEENGCDRQAMIHDATTERRSICHTRAPSSKRCELEKSLTHVAVPLLR